MREKLSCSVARDMLPLLADGLLSAESEEMLRTCSRLIVMRDRNTVGELTGEELTQERVMHTIAGGKE